MASGSRAKPKLSKWAKRPVVWTEGRDCRISVVFSWQVGEAVEQARFHRALGLDVTVGGPATMLARKRFEGVATIGTSEPEAVTRHNPDATFASRGCDVGCYFCVVPKLEGRTYTLVPDFVPRPILCDNNLSGLPADYQAHVVERYRSSGVPLLDANSGFEPRTFDEDTFERWKPIMRGPWRFALDETAELEDVRRTMSILAGVANPRRKRVYVLIGNEPFDACMERIARVLEWGGEPHVQPIMRLNAPVKAPWVRFDWTAERLRDVARWANRRIYKYAPFAEYDRFKRTRAHG